MTEQDIYQRVADEAMRSTEDAWVRWRDPEVGKTIAVGMGGEMRDALAMSNYDAALRILAEHVDSGDVTEDTVGRSGRTWLKVLSFRVYDEDGNITQAWKDAVDNVFLPLKDYPILDEDDYSEREWNLFGEEMRFIFGAAADKVIDALCDAGEAGRIEEFDYDRTFEAVEAVLASGKETLTDEEADALRFTFRQYVTRNGAEQVPTLAARLADPEEDE